MRSALDIQTADFVTVALLVVLEGLLSADNALVMAIMVLGLPKDRHHKALRYGLVGGFIFRILATLLATYLIKVGWVRLLGGLYLLYLSYSHFFSHEHGEDRRQAPKAKPWLGMSAFWATVVRVELVNLAFSIDSILVAVAMSPKLWVVVTGGILGMGETPDQRVEFAETVRDLGVDCVPVNFLNPRPGTPMADLKAITPGECLAAIAVFRLMMPAANIFVMGGREVNLGDQQHLIFRAGANGTMVGNYLTSAGRAPDQVLGMVSGQGLRLRGPEDGREWAFQGQAPVEANWNQRALEGDKRPAKLPVVR